METQEVTIEGSHQETVHIEEGDTVSRVVKRTVLHSGGDQKEVSAIELQTHYTASHGVYYIY